MVFTTTLIIILAVFAIIASFMFFLIPFYIIKISKTLKRIEKYEKEITYNTNIVNKYKEEYNIK